MSLYGGSIPTHFNASSVEIGCLFPAPSVEWRKFQHEVRLDIPQLFGYWGLANQYLYI